MCEIEGVGPVPVAVAGRLLGDAVVSVIIRDGVDIRSVTHLGRQPTAHQRTALRARDPECVVAGCHVRQGLQIDHVDPWVPSFVTTLDRLARLCRHHHGLKTFRGWRLEGEPGHWRLVPPANVAEEQAEPERGGRGRSGEARPPPGRANPQEPPEHGQQTLIA